MCDYPRHHVISEQLGAQRSQALSLFHAYTGCDLPSSIFSIVKKWMKCVVCFSCCKYLCRPDLRPNQPYHQFPQYGMSGTPDCADVGPKLWLNPVSEARKWLSTHGLKSLDSIPPTQHALFQHANVHWWCFHKDAKLPGPTVWGWEWHGRTRAWVPYWTELPDFSWVAVCCCIVDVQLCAGWTPGVNCM